MRTHTPVVPHINSFSSHHPIQNKTRFAVAALHASGPAVRFLRAEEERGGVSLLAAERFICRQRFRRGRMLPLLTRLQNDDRGDPPPPPPPSTAAAFSRVDFLQPPQQQQQHDADEEAMDAADGDGWSSSPTGFLMLRFSSGAALLLAPPAAVGAAASTSSPMLGKCCCCPAPISSATVFLDDGLGHWMPASMLLR